MTKEERHLWYDFLSTYNVRFQRQKTIDRYIADFYCCTAKLVIEIDGGQHYVEESFEYDRTRTECFEKVALKVIRFTNIEINKNFFAVCDEINKEVIKRTAAQSAKK